MDSSRYLCRTENTRCRCRAPRSSAADPARWRGSCEIGGAPLRHLIHIHRNSLAESTPRHRPSAPARPKPSASSMRTSGGVIGDSFRMTLVSKIKLCRAARKRSSVNFRGERIPSSSPLGGVETARRRIPGHRNPRGRPHPIRRSQSPGREPKSISLRSGHLSQTDPGNHRRTWEPWKSRSLSHRRQGGTS